MRGGLFGLVVVGVLGMSGWAQEVCPNGVCRYPTPVRNLVGKVIQHLSEPFPAAVPSDAVPSDAVVPELAPELPEHVSIVQRRPVVGAVRSAVVVTGCGVHRVGCAVKCVVRRVGGCVMQSRPVCAVRRVVQRVSR